MGSDLSLRHARNPFADLPEWGIDRSAGARDFAELKPRIEKEFAGSDEFEAEWLFRPADFSAWRAALNDVNGPFARIYARGWEDTIADRHRMLDAMEADPNLWARWGQ